MKKLLSTVGIFTAGFVVCAVAFSAANGQKPSFFPDGRAKQAVLTSLTQNAAPARRFVGDSVVADAAAKLEPAIVTVHTLGKAVALDDNSFGNDPMFRQFFGGPRQPQQSSGAGSGVIISSDGYIITNDHVVADTSKLTVNVNEKGYDAKVVGTDPLSDIAVVKIDPQGMKLPVAELGNSDDLRVGDWAIAVGNPLDIGTTVTLGIVSAVNRKNLSAENRQLVPSIQTDAAINPGNSGGALANIAGQVIGINEAIYSPTGSYVGIGFAIPINEAKRIAAQLIKNGKVTRPYLGISYGPLKGLTAAARREYGISTTSDDGVVIEPNEARGVPAVSPNSPAAQAGLRQNDVIVAANNQKIGDQDVLNTIIQKQKVGDTLTLTIVREGKTLTVPVTLRERPAAFGQSQEPQQTTRPRLRQFFPGP